MYLYTKVVCYARQDCKLHKTATMVVIWYNKNLYFNGMMPDRILNVFILLIALSTWILTEAINLDRLRALLLKHLACEKAGILRVDI